MAAEDDALFDMVEQQMDRLMQRVGARNGGGKPPTPPAKSGGSGDNDPMETRVSAIENKLAGIDQRLVGVEVKLGHIDTEVTNLKWYLLGAALTIVVTVIGTVIGTGYGIQQMTVQTFQAAGQDRAAPAPAQTVQPIVIQLPAQQPPAAQPEAPAK